MFFKSRNISRKIDNNSLKEIQDDTHISNGKVDFYLNEIFHYLMDGTQKKSLTNKDEMFKKLLAQLKSNFELEFPAHIKRELHFIMNQMHTSESRQDDDLSKIVTYPTMSSIFSLNSGEYILQIAPSLTIGQYSNDIRLEKFTSFQIKIMMSHFALAYVENNIEQLFSVKIGSLPKHLTTNTQHLLETDSNAFLYYNAGYLSLQTIVPGIIDTENSLGIEREIINAMNDFQNGRELLNGNLFHVASVLITDANRKMYPNSNLVTPLQSIGSPYVFLGKLIEGIVYLLYRTRNNVYKMNLTIHCIIKEIVGNKDACKLIPRVVYSSLIMKEPFFEEGAKIQNGLAILYINTLEVVYKSIICYSNERINDSIIFFKMCKLAFECIVGIMKLKNKEQIKGSLIYVIVLLDDLLYTIHPTTMEGGTITIMKIIELTIKIASCIGTPLVNHVLECFNDIYPDIINTLPDDNKKLNYKQYISSVAGSVIGESTSQLNASPPQPVKPEIDNGDHHIKVITNGFILTKSEHQQKLYNEYLSIPIEERNKWIETLCSPEFECLQNYAYPNKNGVNAKITKDDLDAVMEMMNILNGKKGNEKINFDIGDTSHMIKFITKLEYLTKLYENKIDEFKNNRLREEDNISSYKFFIAVACEWLSDFEITYKNLVKKYPGMSPNFYNYNSETRKYIVIFDHEIVNKNYDEKLSSMFNKLFFNLSDLINFLIAPSEVHIDEFIDNLKSQYEDVDVLKTVFSNISGLSNSKETIVTTNPVIAQG
jgi:hypothetical protein